MRDYVAFDPRTGRPLSFGKIAKSGWKDEAFRPPSGYWDAIKHHEILPLASSKTKAIEVRWHERPKLVGRADGVRALPRILGQEPEQAHMVLLSALGDLDPEIRKSGLFALPYCALSRQGELFEWLDELLDDIDPSVRQAASNCLEVVAPVFPSATEQILADELRSEVKARRKAALNALREMCLVWPDVVAEHLDELLRDPSKQIRAESSKLLVPLARHKSAKVWDVISWSFNDDSPQVRIEAAKTLPTLANSAPRIAKILLEHALFDHDERVRKPALRALNSIDVAGFRMRQLCLDGVRHSDPSIRKTCIMMLPRILTKTELRVEASELVRQETHQDLLELLKEFARDADIEGTEEEKNRSLASLPAETRDDGEVELLQPPREFTLERSESKSPQEVRPHSEKKTSEDHE